MNIFTAAVGAALKLHEVHDRPDRDEWVQKYMPAVMEEIQAVAKSGPPIELVCESYDSAMLQVLALTMQWCYLLVPDEEFVDILMHVMPPELKREFIRQAMDCNL